MISLPYANKWHERTVKEINEVKVNHCKKHKCPYFRRFATSTFGHNSYNHCVGNCFCAYLDVTGKLRGCLPEDCTHYMDENVPPAKERYIAMHK